MQRALRYDGLLPNALSERGEHIPLTPDHIQAIAAYVRQHRSASTPFEIVVEGKTPGDDRAAARSIVQPWIEVGATWWIEALWPAPDQPSEPDEVLRRIRQGPPRLA
jgi:hypothetical protein